MQELAAASPKTDLSKALAEIEAIKTGVGDLTIRMAALEIKSQDDYDKAALIIKEANQVLKKFDKKEDTLTGAAKRFVEKIHDTIKAIRTTIELGVKETKRRGNKFIQDEADRKQKELDRLAQQKAKAEQAAVEADTTKQQAQALGKATTLETKIEQVQKRSTGNAGKRRIFKIIDKDLIPREYLIPDEKKIRAAGGGVNDPIPNIPGVEFSNVTEMRG